MHFSHQRRQPRPMIRKKVKRELQFGRETKQFTTSGRFLLRTFSVRLEIHYENGWKNPWTMDILTRVFVHCWFVVRCLPGNRPMVSTARPFRNSCIFSIWFGYASFVCAKKWQKETVHTLQIAFTYVKQRTLHVPVVWPSAPCTQDT